MTQRDVSLLFPFPSSLIPLPPIEVKRREMTEEGMKRGREEGGERGGRWGRAKGLKKVKESAYERDTKR